MKTIKEFRKEVESLSEKYLGGREVSVFVHYPHIDHYMASISSSSLIVEYNFILNEWKVELNTSYGTIHTYLQHNTYNLESVYETFLCGYVRISKP